MPPFVLLLVSVCRVVICPAAIEERIASWTLLPVHNGEGMQVLRYGPGQKYDAHWVSGCGQQCSQL